EVTRLAIASMVQRGLLKVIEEKRRLTTTKKIDRGRQPEPRELQPVEAAVWKWSGFPAEPRQIFAPSGGSSRVKEACGSYEADLAEAGLLAPRGEMTRLATWLWSFGLAALILLGSYKLVVAHAKGHSNVGFLWVMMIVGAIAYSIACWAM